MSTADHVILYITSSLVAFWFGWQLGGLVMLRKMIKAVKKGKELWLRQ